MRAPKIENGWLVFENDEDTVQIRVWASPNDAAEAVKKFGSDVLKAEIEKAFKDIQKAREQAKKDGLI